MATIVQLRHKFVTKFVRIRGICKEFAGDCVNKLTYPRCGVVPQIL